MSWYRDPQLFIYQFVAVHRITVEFGIRTVVSNDLKEGEILSFSKHLSLGNNKEGDFDAFKASFPQSESTTTKFINCRGLVINWPSGTWSLEEPNSPFWSLPGITKPNSVIQQAENQALAKENSDLKEKISSLQDEVSKSKAEKEAIIDKRVLALEAENAILKGEFNRERDGKNALIDGLKREDMLAGLTALQQHVMDLTSKLDQCCGVAGDVSPIEEPWITNQTVPGNWVSFGELDVLPLSKNPTLTITKAAGGSKLGDDKTTNIQAKCFYRGIYPIVVVDVAELTPNREEARFDSSVWGLFDNAGICYAARKPFASEMLVDVNTTY